MVLCYMEAIGRAAKDKASMRQNASMHEMGDKAEWVASGVEFSKSMEVYVFRT